MIVLCLSLITITYWYFQDVDESDDDESSSSSSIEVWGLHQRGWNGWWEFSDSSSWASEVSDDSGIGEDNNYDPEEEYEPFLVF